MFIAVICELNLITRKQVFEDSLEQRQKDDPNFQIRDIELLKKESPLHALKFALESYDNQVEFLAPNSKLQSLLEMGKFDLILNATNKESTNYLPAHYVALCELSGIPYCGSKMDAIGICKNKALFKSLLQLNHIATSPFEKIKIQHGKIPPNKNNRGYPQVVKSFTEGIHNSKIPDQIVNNASELQALLEMYAKKHEFSYVLVEEYIPGKKYYLPILGNDLNDNLRFLPMLEYTYADIADSKALVGRELPEPSISFLETTNPIFKRARFVAEKAYKFFNCRDYAMIVFLQDERNGNLLLHEINPITSLLITGKIAMSGDHIGIAYDELINDIVLYGLIRYELKIRGKYSKKLKQPVNES
jgi:D-alanine-D-alanine ligase-like ATP-grasp enzyme